MRINLHRYQLVCLKNRNKLAWEILHACNYVCGMCLWWRVRMWLCGGTFMMGWLFSMVVWIVTGIYVFLWALSGFLWLCVWLCMWHNVWLCVWRVRVRVWHCGWDNITLWFYVVFFFWLCMILCMFMSLRVYICEVVVGYDCMWNYVWWYVYACVWLCVWYSTHVRLWGGIECRTQGGWLCKVPCVTSYMQLYVCDCLWLFVPICLLMLLGPFGNGATGTLFFSFYFNCYLKNFHSEEANFPFHYDIF